MQTIKINITDFPYILWGKSLFVLGLFLMVDLQDCV